eukprot:TRINITY_DN13605_c0_g1_i1.p1 TRINITY_DN13605_c0_g1~~TRINITY_DN13605_c0_g1_i1.p1  ORF type:complete len:246 (+),score=15.34 TRINITY_DN13605_c0_g1_i1:246-983(+)
MAVNQNQAHADVTRCLPGFFCAHPHCLPETKDGWQSGLLCPSASFDANGCVDACCCAASLLNPCVPYCFMLEHLAHDAKVAATDRGNYRPGSAVVSEQPLVDELQAFCMRACLTFVCCPCAPLMSILSCPRGPGDDARMQGELLMLPTFDRRPLADDAGVHAREERINERSCNMTHSISCCLPFWPFCAVSQLHREARVRGLIRHPAFLVQVARLLCCASDADRVAFANAQAVYLQEVHLSLIHI